MDVRDYKSVWDKYKAGLMPRLLEIGVIIFVMSVLQPSTWYWFAFLLSTTILILGIAKRINRLKNVKLIQSVKNWVKSFIIGAVLWWMWALLSGWTIIFGIIAIAAYRMWQQKKLVKEVIKGGVDLLEGK